MNERIRELAEQTGWRYDNGEWQFADDSDIEKFAELIVRECAEYAEHKLDMAGYKKKFMLKHFGVEE
jgi:S-ribosylhomocysteine lyase LuxS involved in autoinducer biosynthesis